MDYRKKTIEVAERVARGEGSITAICKKVGLNRSTFYRYKNILEEEGKTIGGVIRGQKEVNEMKPKKRKHTFEIDANLHKAIKVQAAIEGKTINNFINDLIKNSISNEVKKLIDY